MRGSIRQRGERWTWQHVIGTDAEGKRRYVTGTERTKGAAAKALTASLAKYDTGQATERTKVTMATFLREWLDEVEHDLKAGTLRGYRDMVEHRLVPHLGSIKLTALSAADIARCYKALRVNGRRNGGGGLSETSISNTHLCLHAALETAVTKRLIVRNPSDDLKAPRRNAHEMTTWDAEQLGRFLDSVAGHRLRELFIVLATTGMRRGEVCALRWEDVDWEHSRLSIRRSRTMVNYDVVEQPPKNGKPRVIGLDSVTLAALKAAQQHQRTDAMALGRLAYVNSGYCFTDPTGEPLHPHAVTDAFDRAVRASGLPRIRLHDLRHTMATVMLADGVNVKVVQERLGHAKAGFTLDRYAHATVPMQSEAAEGFADLVFGGHQ
jgi:integrase